MKLLKRIFDFYLDTSIHVGLSVFALAQVTFYNLGLPFDDALSYALFFGTIVEYSFIKYSPLAKHYIFVTQKYIRSIQLFSAICFLVALYFVFQLQAITVIIASVLVLLAFLYVVPAISSKQNFRSLKGVKIYIVAITWSVSTVILPLLNSDSKIEWIGFLEFLQRFLFIIILMIPFEIRDLKADEPWLRTLPQVLGEKGVKVFGGVLTILFLIIAIVKSHFFGMDNLVVESIISGLLVLAVVFAKKEQSSYFSRFFVESISVIWWLLLWAI
ncbi:UbiA prenyltransferase family protein [Galbibacter mesophilus]|uniref:hypothetical protein n=1 Tax=Galbibacter mesophilus TaxID=379069 RepID=UPI00191D7E22|nr:hypothetical protein [Galbibacter mesophilus]MCM5661675.1 hypothetical protein [Galbibacter mesophilus]